MKITSQFTSRIARLVGIAFVWPLASVVLMMWACKWASSDRYNSRVARINHAPRRKLA